MTAIVGVLNKHAVAIAADSAVTIGGRKVMNSANKIFALSKYHPVGIAIYGNAELVGTPWEIIIKEYRKQLGEIQFDSLDGYAFNFLEYLKARNYFCTQEESNNALLTSVFSFLDSLVSRDRDGVFDTLASIKSRIPANFLDGFSDEYVEYFKSVTLEMLTEYTNFIREKISLDISVEDLSDILAQAFTKGIPESRSGLVFVGYGKKDYFPAICSCEVGNVIKDNIARFPMLISKVTKDNRSMICPFAQTDVMSTILEGVSPKVQEVYSTTLKNTIDKVITELANDIEGSDADLAEKIRNIDRNKFTQAFYKLSQQSIEKEYTKPFVKSVATLEKDDLADFAESLITLTSLKRKVSLDQETVGGPVDVMIISKGDGVIWKKRKHYFNKDLNHHFFENYFKD